MTARDPHPTPSTTSSSLASLPSLPKNVSSLKETVPSPIPPSKLEKGHETDALLPPPSTSNPQSSSELYGYFLMLISTFGFSGMTLFVHIAEDKYDFTALECVFVRAVTHVFLCLAYLWKFEDIPALIRAFSRRQIFLLVIRGLLGAVGITAMFTSLGLLPVGDSVAIFFSGPVITMLLSALILGETVSGAEMLCAAVSFAGVLFIARPGMSTEHMSAKQRLVGAALSLAAATLTSCAYVVIRKLGRGIHFMTSVLSLSVMTVPVAIALGGSIGYEGLREKGMGSVIVLLSALLGWGGQSCLNNALQHCRAGPGLLVRNLDVPIAYVLGLIFLGEKPSWLSYFGSGLVLAATCAIGWKQIKK